MNVDYFPHQNLEDPSNIIEKSKIETNAIFNKSNNNHFTNLNQQINDINDYINNVKNEIEFSSNDLNNNLNNNIYDNKTENLQLSIYQKLSLVSNQLLRAKEQIKFLTQENLSLKNIISNKDKIISDFENLTMQFKQKFQKLELINDNLKNQLMSKTSKDYIEQNILDDTNLNFKSKYNINKDILDYNINKNSSNKEDFNNYNSKYNFNYNNDIGEYKKIDDNNNNKIYNEYELKIKNNELIDNINNIKKDLELIENDYQIQLREKDCYIEQINCELINLYKEYVKLSDILEELNYLVTNSNYNELKTEFNCLLREKEILLKEKEKDHMEIISLRERFMEKPYDCRNLNTNNNQSDELIKIFDEKEKQYINQIDSLKENLMTKIKEIDELKNKQDNLIREYEFKIENLLKNH